jgi:hypothetical protein
MGNRYFTTVETTKVLTGFADEETPLFENLYRVVPHEAYLSEGRWVDERGEASVFVDQAHAAAFSVACEECGYTVDPCFWLKDECSSDPEWLDEYVERLVELGADDMYAGTQDLVEAVTMYRAAMFLAQADKNR